MQPIYFKDWIECVKIECIQKTERIIAKFESVILQKDLPKALKMAVNGVNKLDEN
jgi:hypothetical protein